MDSGLTDSCVLITGASGGIGLATAELFAAEGAKLILHYHTQAEPVRRLHERIQGQSIPVQADLRDELQVQGLFAEGLIAFPRIDALVVNAGIFTSPSVPLHEMTLEQWRHTLDADLTSAFFTCRCFLQHLADSQRESASIVLVASTAAIFGEAGHADYAAAKAAMAYGLTLSLKNEIVQLAPRGRVNCVCPGWTRTPMAEPAMSDPRAVRRVQATMALEKIAEPEDVAAAIVFLTSERLAGHLSGTVLPVAGGMEGRLLHSGH
jgi:NAD(P)-dependent dehydrogenase (short-subunit alcohol dehydrogenase family)